MPARIIVVLDEPGFADKAADALKAAGFDALAIHDPMSAIDALQQINRLQLLITCPEFQPGKPTGIAIARMARYRRRNIKALFIGPHTLAPIVSPIGDYMATPVTAADVVKMAATMLTEADAQPPSAA